MNTIFAYTDYRQFLKDRYAHLKATQPAFSYRYFSQRAGFSSPNFLKLVMDGARNLSPESTHKFGQVLKLGSKEQRFFDLLVQYNQASDPHQRQHYYEQLLESPEYCKAHHLVKEQFEYLSHWYYPALVELFHLSTAQDDPQWIAEHLRISVKEAREALEVLVRLGMIARGNDGKLKPAHAAITTGPEAQTLAAYHYHEQILDLARAAVTEQDPGEREFAAITMAVSEKQLAHLKGMIRDFRKMVVNYLSKPDEHADEVYQFGVQLFALTQGKGVTQHEDEKG